MGDATGRLNTWVKHRRSTPEIRRIKCPNEACTICTQRPPRRMLDSSDDTGLLATLRRDSDEEWPMIFGVLPAIAATEFLIASIASNNPVCLTVACIFIGIAVTHGTYKACTKE